MQRCQKLRITILMEKELTVGERQAAKRLGLRIINAYTDAEATVAYQQ